MLSRSQPDITVKSIVHPIDVLQGVLSKPAQRSAAEIRVILDKLKLLAEAFSPYPDIKIRAGRGCGWSCALPDEGMPEFERYLTGKIPTLDHIDPKLLRPHVINVDLNDIEVWPESQLIGVQSHEIGHAKHTDYKLFLQGQREAIRGGNLPSSWAGLLNALEDPWINNREMAESDPRGFAIKELYLQWVDDHQRGVENNSLLTQLGLNIVHYWATGKNIPTLHDERVLMAWESIRPAAEKYFQGKHSLENFRLLQAEIWPLVKHLEEMSCEDQLLNDLSKRLQEGPQSSSTIESTLPSENGEGPTSMTKKMKGLFERFKDALLGSSDAGQEKGTAEKKGVPQQESDDKINQELKDAAAQVVPSDFSNKKDASGNLTKEERDKLAEILKQVSPETREILENNAREAINKEQGEFQRKTFGNPVPAKPKELKESDTKDIDTVDLKDLIQSKEKELIEAQLREDAEAERQRELDAARLAKEIRDNQMRRDGFTPDVQEEEDLFDRYKMLESATASYIGPFMRSLIALLPKERQLSFEGSFYSGKKVDVREIPRRAPVKDYKVYTRPTVEESPRPKMFIQLLIDNTASMAGSKLEETLKATIFWGKVLEEFEIPFAIKLFGSSVVPIKNFEQKLGDGRNRIKFNLLTLANASMNSTDIGEGLIAAKNEMETQRRSYKDSLGAIFLLSDSGANSGITGEALAETAAEISRRYVLTNFILTRNQREIGAAKKIFGERNVVAPQDFTELCPESIRVLRGTLDSFRRRLKL